MPNAMQVELFDTRNPRRCPCCKQFAIVPLPDRLLEKQSDGTTHVCLPPLGGCNRGFAETLTVTRSNKKVVR